MEDLTTLTKNTVKNIIGQKLEKIQDIKKHECPYCGQKFVKKQFLSSHLQIRHNVVEKLDLKSDYVNVKSKVKKSLTKELGIYKTRKRNFTQNFEDLTEEDLLRIKEAVDKINKFLTKSSESLKNTCEKLMVEMKYMICEYKSPFIIL